MDLEWFSNVGTVPGVSWDPDIPPAPAQHYAGAAPTLEDFGDWQRVSWSVSSGKNARRLDRSPVALVGPSAGVDGSVGELVVATCAALREPGTRYDYFDLLTLVAPRLTYLQEQDASGVEWAESFDQLAVQLVRGGPQRAAAPYGLGDRDPNRFLKRGLQPFQSIIQRYVREGFLLEAVPVYLEMMSLAGPAAPDYFEGFDPRPALAALEELAQ